jgi:hypothetical protein
MPMTPMMSMPMPAPCPPMPMSMNDVMMRRGSQQQQPAQRGSAAAGERRAKPTRRAYLQMPKGKPKRHSQKPKKDLPVSRCGGRIFGRGDAANGHQTTMT